MQFHIAMRVRMFNRCQMLARNNNESRFFLTFPHCAGSRRLIAFAFPAWKFSKPRQGDIGGSSTNKNPACRFNDRNSNSHCLLHGELFLMRQRLVRTVESSVSTLPGFTENNNSSPCCSSNCRASCSTGRQSDSSDGSETRFIT